MNDFTKKITFDLDDSKLIGLMKSFDESALSQLFTGEGMENVRKAFEEAELQSAKVKRLQMGISDAEKHNLPELAKQLRAELEKILPKKEELEESEPASTFGSKARKAISKGWDTTFNEMKSYAKKAWDGIVDIAKDAWDEIINAASYSSSSKIYSSDVTDLKLKYGFSDAQAYAYSQAYGSLGVDDIAKMTSTQQAYYSDLFQQYLAEYQEMEEEGTLSALQDVQVEWEQFQRDMEMTVMDFISDNSEQISDFLDDSIQFMSDILPIVSGILSGVSFLVNLLPSETASAGSADAMSAWAAAGVSNINHNISTSIAVSGSVSDAINEATDAYHNTLVTELEG